MFAQFTADNTGELGTYATGILEFINQRLVPLLFAVALVLFIYGIFLFFIKSGGEDDGKKKGGSYMLWSIVAFVIMVSVWGITNLVAGGLGFDQEEAIPTPQAPVDNP